MNLQENIQRILEVMNVIEPNQKLSDSYDYIFIGGLDEPPYKPLDKQFEIFIGGYQNRKGKAFRHNTSVLEVLNVLKNNPKIPLFLFSKGCELADELIKSKLVDKNKLYLIEPYNSAKNLNRPVKNAIELGLSPNNIFVGRDRSTGVGFEGANSSRGKNHWDALRSVGQKFAK